MTIYFAEMGSRIKIGYTLAKDASKRIAQLQTGQPEKIALLGTIPGERDAESGLHQEFDSSRVNGEWFYRDEIISSILFLIENQHPWYFCRQKAIGLCWERAFKVTPPADMSAYDDPQVSKPPVPSSILSRAANIRIRQHRRVHGRDPEWEARICETIASTSSAASYHPYLSGWKSCQSQNSTGV